MTFNKKIIFENTYYEYILFFDVLLIFLFSYNVCIENEFIDYKTTYF